MKTHNLKSLLLIFISFIFLSEQSLALPGFENLLGAEEKKDTVDIFSTPTQEIRFETRKVQSGFIRLRNANEYSSLTSEINELNSYIKDQAKDLTRKELQVLNDSTFRTHLWNSFINFYNMIFYAKKGYFELAINFRDFTWVSLIDLFSTKFPDLTEQEKTQIHQMLLISIFQFAHAKAGPANNLIEKKNTDFIITEFYHLFDIKNNGPYLKSIYKKWGLNPEMGNLYLKGLMTSALGVLSSLLPMFWVSEPIPYLLKLGAIISGTSFLYFFFLHPVLHYLVLKFWRPYQRISYFKKLNFDYTVDSFLKSDLPQDVLKFFDQNKQNIKNSDSSPDNQTLKTEENKTNNLNVENYLKAENLQWLNPKEPLSNTNNGQLLFKTISSSDKYSDLVEQNIKENPELLEQAKLGAEFRNYYLTKMQSTFGIQNFNFILDPEMEMLRNLIILNKINTESQSQLMTYEQASLIALTETKNRFGLSENTDFNELENEKNNANIEIANHYLAAFMFYKKRLIALENQEANNNIKKIDLEKFKQEFQNKIIELRVLNFKQALNDYRTQNPEALEIKIRTTTGIQSIKITDLLQAQMTLTPQNSTTIKHFSYDTRLNDNFAQNKLDIAAESGKKDIPGYEDFYTVKPITPILPNQHLILDGSFGKVVVDELNFSQLLYELGPKYYIYNAPLESNILYQIEAARRDTLLADSLSFLLNQNDKEVSQLENRLKIRMNNRAKTPFRTSKFSTFTEELQIEKGLTQNNTLLEKLRWQGFSIQPNFWRIRDLDHEEIENNTSFKVMKFANKNSIIKSYNTRSVEKYKTQVQQKEESNIKKLLSKNRYRNPIPKRVFKVVDWVIVPTVIVTVLTGAFNIAINSISDKSGSSDQTISRSSESQSSNSIHFELSDPTNHSQESQLSQNQNNNLEQFTLQKRNSDTELPYYLNFPVLENLPSNLNEEEKLALAGKSTRLEVDSTIWSTTVNDPQRNLQIDSKKILPFSWQLNLKSNTPLVATGNFLPIPSPSGYRIYEIKIIPKDKIYDLDHSDEDYEVFFDNHTGLSYARLKNSISNHNFYYIQVKYKKILPMQNPNKSLFSIDSKKLQQEITTLKDLGAKTLSSDLKRLTSKYPNLQASSLAAQFSASAIYTYDSASSWNILNYLSMNPFKNYKKFLKDGVFYYQCSGSNSLYADFLKNYYESQNIPVTVTNLVGFTVKQDDYFQSFGKVGPIGHMHTLAYATNSSYTYQELDATPSTMDPKYKKSKDFVEPKNTGDEKQPDIEFTGDQRTKNKVVNNYNVDKPSYFKYELKSAILPSRRLKVITETHPKIKNSNDDNNNESNSKNKNQNKADPIEFENLVKQIHIHIPKVSSQYPQLKKIGREKIFNLDSLSLIPFLRTYLNEPSESELYNLLKQAQRVVLEFPTFRPLSIEESQFLDEKLRDLISKNQMDKQVTLHQLFLLVKNNFELQLKNYNSNPNSRNPLNTYAYLSDLSLVQLLNNYLEYIVQNDFNLDFLNDKTHTENQNKINQQLCQSLF